MAMSPSPGRPPVPAWSSDSSFSKHNNNGAAAKPPAAAAAPRNSSLQRAAPSTLPINLSLSEDERSPIRSGDSISPHFPKSQLPNHNLQQGAEDEDEEEDLYEYFPLSLDDW